MPDIASLSVNNSRDEGEFASNEIVNELKEIRRVLEEGNRALSTEEKKGRGFPGLGGAGMLGAALGAITAAFPFTRTAGQALGGAAGNMNEQYSFEKFRYEEGGPTYVARIDRETGEIVEIMTEQQAKQRQILDEYSNWHEGIHHQNTVFDEIGSSLRKVRDTYILEESTIKNISAENDRQLTLLKELNDAISRRVQEMGGTPSSPSAPGMASPANANFSSVSGASLYIPPPSVSNSRREIAESIIRDNFDLLDPSFYLGGRR